MTCQVNTFSAKAGEPLFGEGKIPGFDRPDFTRGTADKNVAAQMSPVAMGPRSTKAGNASHGAVMVASGELQRFARSHRLDGGVFHAGSTLLRSEKTEKIRGPWPAGGCKCHARSFF